MSPFLAIMWYRQLGRPENWLRELSLYPASDPRPLGSGCSNTCREAVSVYVAVHWSLEKSVPLQRTSCTVTNLVLFIHVYPEFFSFLPIISKLRTKPGSFLFHDRSCKEQPKSMSWRKYTVRRWSAPQPLPCRSADLALLSELMPGPWCSGSWPEAVRQQGYSAWLLLPSGLSGQSLPPYLSSGLCSNLSLPHTSHVGHEKAVLSSTPTTVPRPKWKQSQS